MTGYVCIPREALEMFKPKRFSKREALIDLWELAAYKEGSFHVAGTTYKYRRGEVCWSQVALAKRWAWSVPKVKRFLNELETLDQTLHQNERHFTRITICNYSNYSGHIEAGVAPERTQNVAPDVAPDVRHIKEGKERKEERKKKINKKESSPLRSVKFKKEPHLPAKPKNKKSGIEKPDGVDSRHWEDWLRVRKEKRSPLTESALRLFRSECKKLDITLAQGVRVAAENGWSGIRSSWESAQTAARELKGGNVKPIPPVPKDFSGDGVKDWALSYLPEIVCETAIGPVDDRLPAANEDYWAYYSRIDGLRSSYMSGSLSAYETAGASQ